MADQKESTEAAAPRAKGGMKTVLLTAVVGLVSAGAGFAVPQVIGGRAAESGDESSKSNGSHGGGSAHGSKPPKNGHGDAGAGCVPFGECVANLDDNRMMRYVRAKFALAVDKKDVETVQHAVEANKTVLKNWLIGYLQNKQIDEVRGTEGFNRIRREIQEHFALVLFPDDEEIIKEVLFEEFNVQ